MRKKNSILGIICLSIAILSACNSNNSTNSNKTNTESPTETTSEPSNSSGSDKENQSVKESDGTYNLLGYTPFGVQILKATDSKDTSDYIFINADEGWKASCEAQGMQRESIILYKTDDGGKTWSELTSTNDENYSIPFYTKTGMIFTDSQNGWLTTQIPQPGFVGLYQSSDGGVEWVQKQLDIPAAYTNVEFATYPPVFFTKNDALLITNQYEEGIDQLVFATHDGGQSWKQIGNDGDDVFKWSYTDKTADGNASGWSIIFDSKTWSTKDGITWEGK